MIINGDSMKVLKILDENSVDSIVTDPPYGLSFMGKAWDHSVPSAELWKEALRVLKPGGYILAFAGTRTQHRMAVNIEDAGFEIRDMIAWVYGSGFPKSHNIGKAVDKIQGVEVEQGEKFNVVGGTDASNGGSKFKSDHKDYKKYEAQNKYEGWGTALKPALEPITVARKPLKGTVANNILEWGTGGINIDGSRVGTGDNVTNHSRGADSAVSKGKYGDSSKQETHQTIGQQLGRFPANLIHDGSDEVVGLLGEPARFFYCAKAGKAERNKGLNGLNCAIIDICKDENTEQVTSLLRDILESIPNLNIDESGLRLTVQYPKDTMSTILTTINQITDLKTYSLLMQSPTRESMKDVLSKMINGLSPVESVKSLSELTMTTGTFQEKGGLVTEDVGSATYQKLLKLKDESEWKPRTSTHPTVKPVRLMQYLVKLVTPVGGIVLDPFNGSGTTGIACKLEGFEYIGIELDPEYCTLSEARIKAWAKEAEQASML